jgi:hypothetical protein
MSRSDRNDGKVGRRPEDSSPGLARPRGRRSEDGLSQSAQQAPGAESHADLSSSLQSVFGNTQVISALSGDALEGPGRIIQGALTLAAAGLEVPASATSLLSNSLVSGWIGDYGSGQDTGELALREAEREHEQFAHDADRRVRTATRRGGQALPTELRERLQQSFGGVDFSGVRLHTDGSASQASAAINARAFTLGQDIFFNAAGLNLSSRGDQELLLHELTHVVQHLEGRLQARSGANTTDGGMAVSSPTDSTEREAVSTAASLLPSFDAPAVELSGPVLDTTVEAEAPAPAGDQAARSVENPNSNEASTQPEQDPTNTRTDGSVQEQKQSDQLEAWRSDVGMALGRIEAFQKQLEAWDGMAEPEQDKLATEILTFSLLVIDLALQVLETAMGFEGEGMTFGSKLLAVGALTAIVAGALGESANLDTLQGENKQEDSERADDPTDSRFEGFTAWALEGQGKVGDAAGKPALQRVLLGGVRMTELLDGFMGWMAAQRVEKANTTEPPTKRGERLKSQAEDDKGDQQKQLSGFRTKVASLREVASRGGPGRGDRGDQEAATVDEEPRSVQTADAELSEAEKNGLEPAQIATKGAVLRNDRRALRRTWVARLDAGTQLGFEAPMREWVRVLVLDGEHKGKWGFVAHHGVEARRKEPGRAATKDERTEPVNRKARGRKDRQGRARRPKGGGQSLPSKLSALFQPILGDAVDQVRIHTDGAAAGFAESVAATAVTVGRDIYFSGGSFQPGSASGQELLAHELHHAVLGGGKPGISQPGDAHERKADSFAEALVRGGLVEVVDNLLGDKSEDPAAAHGHVTHPRRALQAIKGAVPTSISRHLGDALGVSQGTGLEPGAPGVGLRQLGVGGVPRSMRPPGLTQPTAHQQPREDVANRKADPAESLSRLGADSPAVIEALTKTFGPSEEEEADQRFEQEEREAVQAETVNRKPDPTDPPEGEGDEDKKKEPPPGTDIDALLSTAEESADALKELEEPLPAEEQVCEAEGQDQGGPIEVGEAEVDVNAEGPTLDAASPDLETVSAPPERQAQLFSAPGLAPIPSTAPQGLQQAISGLIQAAQFQKDAISAAGAVQKGSLLGSGETQKAAIAGAVTTVKGNVTADFNATRDAILAKGAATKTAIEGVRDAQKARLDEAATLQLERLVKGVADRKKSVLDLGETLATQAEAHGRNEATRLIQGTRDLATKALGIGEAKVKQFARYDEANEIASTARKMARTVAQDMVNQGAEISAKAIEDGKALALKLREDAREHSQNFEVDEDAVSAIQQARDEAKRGLDEGTTTVLAEVDKSTTEAAKGVEQGLTIALAEVDKIGASVNPAIDAAVRAACAAVDQAVSMAQAEVDKAVNQVVAATGSVHESREAEAIAIVQQVQEALLGGSSTVLSGVDEVGQAGATAIGNAGTEAIGVVAGSETSILDQNAETLRSFEENMDQTVQTVTTEFAKSTDEGIAKVAEACDGFVEKLDEALTEAQDHLNTGYTEGIGEITTKVNETLTGMQTKLNELGPAITKQADDIEHASWWDKLCSAVGAFFRGFWKGLCNFLAGLWTVLKWLAVILVILVVLIVLLAYFAPALLVGLAFLAIAYAGTALAILAWVGIIAGVLLVCVSLYQNWHVWTDPNKSWEEKWEAAGTFAFDVVDAIGPEKFLKPFTGLYKGIKGLLGLGDAAADLSKVDNLTDTQRAVDAFAPPQGSGSVGKADDLDNLGALGRVDTPPTHGAGALDDVVDTSKLDNISASTQGPTRPWNDPNLTKAEFVQQYRQRYPDSDLAKDTQRLGDHFDAGKRLDPDTGRLKVPPEKPPTSGKDWDDPTLTRDEFITDYKAKHPNTSLTDAELARHFDDGKRLHPDTGRMRTPEAKPSAPHGPSNKGWDDPSLTREEFISDYRARYPDSDLAKDPDKLGSMYDSGKRMNPETGRLKQPEWTNKSVREWYSNETNKIPDLDEGWQKAGLSLEERARKASEIRHEARMTARKMMQNPDEVAALQARDLEKYGNPNGPSFDDLVAKGRSKGKTGDEIYEDILGSSSRRSTEYDSKFGVDQPKGTDGPDTSPGGGKAPEDLAAKSDEVDGSSVDVDPSDYTGPDGLRYTHPSPDKWGPPGHAHGHSSAYEAYELVETANKVRHTAHSIEHAAHTVKHINSAKGATDRANEVTHEGDHQEQGH